MRIAVLMTCFNRVKTTLECLEHLHAAATHYQQADIDLWLNDDGSTDGTGEAVQKWFNSITFRSSLFTLHLIKGSGHDYWCGGMRRAWQAAIDSEIDYNGYLWLNDDTILFQNALELMFSGDNEAIITGAVCDRTCMKMTYGGSFARGDLIPIDGTYRPVEKVHGNCVFVPQHIYLKMGNFQPYLTHSLGDVDYSRRALRAGIPLLLTPKYVGTCDANPQLPAWTRSAVPFLNRVKNLYSPLGYCEPFIYFRFCLFHDGLLVALKSFVLQHIRVMLPVLWEKGF